MQDDFATSSEVLRTIDRVAVVGAHDLEVLPG